MSENVDQKSREHHTTLSPSSFPAFKHCPCYKSGKSGAAAIEGTNQHILLEECLRKNHQLGFAKKKFTEAVSSDGLSDVRYAIDEVNKLTDPALREIEVRLSLTEVDEDFNTKEITYGSADILQKTSATSSLLIDYKSGEIRDYKLQMLVYARAAMDKHSTDSCRIVELYGKKRMSKDYTVTYADTEVIFEVIRAVLDPDRKPQPCDYCTWCRDHEICPAITKHAVAAAVEYNDRKKSDKKYFEKSFIPDLQEKLENYDNFNLDNPEEAGLVYEVAKIVGSWASSAKKRIEDALRAGTKINGWKVSNSSEQKFDKDTPVQKIFDQSGLSVEAFTECCTVKIGELRKAIVVDAGLVDDAGKPIRSTNKPAKDEFNQRFGAMLHTMPKTSIKKVEVSNG